LGEVAHHPGAEDAGLGRSGRYQPDTVDLARLGECSGLQQRHCGGGDGDPSEESHKIISTYFAGSVGQTQESVEAYFFSLTPVLSEAVQVV
jgi:hypothetical protein